MNKCASRIFMIVLMAGLFSLFIHAQDEELVGGIQLNSDASTDGYILFSPVGLTATYLIDKEGQVINAWDSDYEPASAMYLTDDGHLIRAGRRGRGDDMKRVVEEFDWDGNQVWEYIFESPRFTLHHDIQPMPNGNILALAWEHIPLDEATELGFVTEGLETDEDYEDIRLDSIFEINPETDAIVWEWHSRDHLVQDVNPDLPDYGNIADHPGRINLNFHDVPQVDDITHMNSIAYHATRDEIIVSVRSFSEIWIIDHSISTEEAKTSAGDIQYRWGNPQAYNQGDESDRTLYYQHDARWLDIYDDNSPLSVFSNGSREQSQSYLIQFKLPDQWLADNNTFNPVDILWQSETDFFAINMSGGEILPDQNMLVTLSPDGRFVEITPDSEIVWEYINPVYRTLDNGDVSNRVFRASFFPVDFIGFEGKILEPQGMLKTGVRQ